MCVCVFLYLCTDGIMKSIIPTPIRTLDVSSAIVQSFSAIEVPKEPEPLSSPLSLPLSLLLPLLLSYLNPNSYSYSYP